MQHLAHEYEIDGTTGSPHNQQSTHTVHHELPSSAAAFSLVHLANHR